MAAKVYHYCHGCEQLISPQINDDRLKERAALVRHVNGQLPPTGHHVWSDTCPKCGHKWPVVLLRVGRQPLARIQRVSKVLGELQEYYQGGYGRGYRNYKKLQQAKCGANNTTPSFGQRIKSGRLRRRK